MVVLVVLLKEVLVLLLSVILRFIVIILILRILFVNLSLQMKKTLIVPLLRNVNPASFVTVLLDAHFVLKNVSDQLTSFWVGMEQLGVKTVIHRMLVSVLDVNVIMMQRFICTLKRYLKLILTHVVGLQKNFINAWKQILVYEVT
jgi:hypothetical protein